MRPHPRRFAAAGLALAFVSAVLPVGQAALAASGPVARWSFDEGSGNTAADAVGTADGTRGGGAAWLTSGVPQGTAALSLDGVDDRVDVAPAPVLEPATLTISAWVRGHAGTPPAAGSVIVEKGAFGCSGGSYGLYVTDDGVGVGYHDPVSGQHLIGLIAADAQVNLWDGDWHLVAASIPSGTYDAQVQIDGYTRSFSTWWQSGQVDHLQYTASDASSLRIGGPVNGACGTPWFAGDVDDVRIWNDPAAIASAAATMPPIPTTTVLAPIGTKHPEQGITMSATVTPVPRFGAIKFELADPATHDTINWAMGTLDGTGHATAIVFTPSGTAYDAIATYVTGPPYVASSDVERIAVEPWPTTTSLAVQPSSPVPTQALTLTASVSSPGLPTGPAPTGSVGFVDTASGADVSLGTATLTPSTQSTSTATVTLSSGLQLGSHTLIVRYAGDAMHAASSSAGVDLSMGTADSFVNAFGPAPTQAHHPATFGAAVGAPIDGWSTDATVTFVVGREGDAAVRRPGDARQQRDLHERHRSPSGCTRSLRDTPATAWLAVRRVTRCRSRSRPTSWRRPGSARRSSTFYPAKDGYRDTVAIGGTRGEPLSVSVTVYWTDRREGEGMVSGPGRGPLRGELERPDVGRDHAPRRPLQGRPAAQGRVRDDEDRHVLRHAVGEAPPPPYAGDHPARIRVQRQGHVRQRQGHDLDHRGNGEARRQGRGPRQLGRRRIPVQAARRDDLQQAHVLDLRDWRAVGRPNRIAMQNFHASPCAGTWHDECFDQSDWDRMPARRHGSHARLDDRQPDRLRRPGIASVFAGTFTTRRGRSRTAS